MDVISNVGVEQLWRQTQTAIFQRHVPGGMIAKKEQRAVRAGGRWNQREGRVGGHCDGLVKAGTAARKHALDAGKGTQSLSAACVARRSWPF